MALPDFLVAGVPKSGTTALHAALARHPGLFLSPIKEPKFFLTDGPPPTKGGPGDALTYREHVWQRDRYEALFDAAPVFHARTKGIAYLDLEGCMTFGVTGPMLRSTGLPWDLRKSQPYCGYETYEFDVPTVKTCDAFGRYLIRMDEVDQSLRIIEQCVDRLAAKRPANDPVMIEDAKIGWPARLALGPDGLGPAPDHIAHIMGQSMEALIHHFKLVTEGFRVPAGQAYVPVESPKGELGCHVVSDGGTRPYRAHLRDPSFHHMQAVAVLCEGGNLADVIPAIASIDPVIGGVDR